MAIVKKNTAAAPAAAPAEAPVVLKAVKSPKAPKAPKTKKGMAPPPPKVEAAVPVTPEVRIGRKDLAKAIYEKVKATGKAVPLNIAEIMTVAYEEAVVEAVSAGVSVILPGFGKYSVSHRPAAQRRNPITGEPVEVPAHRVVRFKVGSSLKAAVSDLGDEDDSDDSESA